MKSVEQQLATLLTDAPGEPPNSIDPDELLARAPHRHRYLAPAVAAAVVLAVAISVTVTNTGDGTDQLTRSIIPATAADPEAEANQRVAALIGEAPVPPGAEQSDVPIPEAQYSGTLQRTPPGSGLQNEVRRTTWWTAPGTPGTAAEYVLRHDLAGMNGSGRAFDPGGAAQFLNFTSKRLDIARLELDYVIVADGSGVAIRVDAWTTWVPSRPRWSYVPDSVTSVDVSITSVDLSSGGPKPGPTVRRNLTGAGARSLAEAVNAFPAVPLVGHSCPIATAYLSDLAVFNSDEGTLRIEYDFCGAVTVTRPGSGESAVAIGGDFDGALRAALGLAIPPR